MKGYYWMSYNKFTVQVDLDENGLIVWTAPITKRFVGQHVSRLKEWMIKLGGYRAERL